MVRGLFICLQFPYAYSSTGGITADLLFPIAWEVVRNLQFVQGLRSYLLLEIEHHKTEKFLGCTSCLTAVNYTQTQQNP